MISKTDLILLLTNLDGGQEYVGKVLADENVPMDVVKFVNDQRELDVSKFYTYIRKSYNQKRSKLYIQIMKEMDDVNEVLITLSSLQLQIMLFSKKVDDKSLFLRHSRAPEISRVLSKYYQNFDTTACVKLLRLVKADIIAFETMQGHRENKGEN